MKRSGTASVALALATGMIVTPLAASAQPYGGYGASYDGRGYGSGYGYGSGGGYGGAPDLSACQIKKRKSQTSGAILGALAGAAIGSQVSGKGARTEGSAVGALAGAVIGSQIGRAQAKQSDVCRQYGYYDGGYQYRTYGQPYYYNDGFFDQGGEWRGYERGYDRSYYQSQYGRGEYYNRYNGGRRY